MEVKINYSKNKYNSDNLLRDRVSEFYKRYKFDLQKKLEEIDGNLSIGFSNVISYQDIKNANIYYGENSDYIGTKTDSGAEKISVPDGGVIYLSYFGIKIPLAWFEIKSSNSCMNGTRGQASGLISEQAERCASWTSKFEGDLKPLVAFMEGMDFNEKFGKYNVERIQMDLHTVGNNNPYEENRKRCVSWLFFQEQFSKDDLDKKIKMVVNENLNKIPKIIESLKNKNEIRCETTVI